jgi:hypothetical protein
VKRRDFIYGSLLAGSSLGVAGALLAGQARESDRPLLIDAHCHAGRGLNYGQSDPNLVARLEGTLTCHRRGQAAAESLSRHLLGGVQPVS